MLARAEPPIIDPDLPAGIPGASAGPAQTGGPCLIAPEPGSLFGLR